MCGLIGAFGNLLHADTKFLKQALICDQFRGEDSVGVAYWGNGTKEPTVVKKVMNPSDFLELRSVQPAFSVSNVGLIGHNRKATLGVVNSQNAHPFQHGDITLTHNGTLTKECKRKLESKYIKSGYFPTDSELICFLFDNFEPEQIIPELEGAFALIWWDAGREELNIIRNDERELNLCVQRGKIHWASERLMLRWLIDRNNCNPTDGQIMEPRPGKLFTFKYKQAVVSYTAKEVKLAEPKKFPATTTTQSQGTGGRTIRNTSVPASPPRFNHTPPDEDLGKRSMERLRNIKSFNDSYNTKYTTGSTVYGWISSVEVLKTVSTEGPKCNVNLTLATDPYLEVRVFYADYDPDIHKEGTEAPAFKCTLRAINFNSKLKDVTGQGWYFQGDAYSLRPVTTQYDEELMDKWSDENSADYPSEKNNQKGVVIEGDFTEKKPEGEEDDIPFKKFKGHNEREISWTSFKRACNDGCCVCGSPIDSEAEMKKQTVKFISSDEVICKGCLRDRDLMRMVFGVENPLAMN